MTASISGNMVNASSIFLGKASRSCTSILLQVNMKVVGRKRCRRVSYILG